MAGGLIATGGVGRWFTCPLHSFFILAEFLSLSEQNVYNFVRCSIHISKALRKLC